MSERRYTIVDVFTDVPLEGNPAAIFSDGSGLDGDLMQRTARELNLSETVFVLSADGDADARVRIFTPWAELPFAGHPILGTAFVLSHRTGQPVITLLTGAGPVAVALRRERDSIVFGEMEQPIPVLEPFERASELLAAVGVSGSKLPIEGYRNGPTHVYIALGSEQEVAELRPNTAALQDLGDGYGFSCFAGSGGRFKTRMFAPALGVPEDPATGSAAGPLALHLARHGWIGWGEEIEIRQGAEVRRPSLLHARVEGTVEHVERVVVGGAAVIVAEGRYRLT